MRRIVVLGDPARVRGFRLAGVTVIEAAGPPGVERAWESVPDDTAVLVLTADAAAVLADRMEERPRLTWAVMPR
jgi:vacuolar-type H+-ATPase subunit F/Vma7